MQPRAAAALLITLVALVCTLPLHHEPRNPPRAEPSPTAPPPAPPAPSPASSPSPSQTATRARTPEPATTPPRTTGPAPEPALPAEPAFARFQQWAAEFARLDPIDRDPASETLGIALARERRDQLAGLIRTHPERALELALSPEAIATLPAAVRPWVETRVRGRGDLEVLCAWPGPDEAPHAESQRDSTQRFALLGGQRYEAFVYGRRLAETTRRGVSLHGIVLDQQMAVAESPVVRLSAAALDSRGAPPSNARCALGGDHAASGPDAVWVEAYGETVPLCGHEHLDLYETQLANEGGLYVGADGTLTAGHQGAALASAAPAASLSQGLKRLLFIRVDFSDLAGEPFSSNRTVALVKELHQFYQENSFGRSGFLNIDSGSDVTPLFRMPRTAAFYGSSDAANLRTDARTAARAAGYDLTAYDDDLTCLGNVPGFGWAGLGYVGAPGAWIRGTSSAGVVAHEIGHNLGLAHANFWDTGGNSVTGTGTSIEYGDKFDTMGAANAGNYHFNARYKRLLGWLTAGECSVATTNGIYRIFAHDNTNAATGSRGLQVFANARTNYWLEFRQRFTANNWLMNGAGLRWTGRGSEASRLLDTTPGSAREKDDSAIVIGRTFSDAIAGVHFTPIAKGGTSPAWLDIAVERGSFSNNKPPVIQLAASATTGTTTTTLEFHAVATDPDGDPLAFAWDFGDDTVGSNAPDISHRWSAAGDYAVHCTASDLHGGTAQATVLVRIGSPTTVVIQGRVTAYGEAVAGARVSAGSGRQTVTDANGTYILAGLPKGTYSLAVKGQATPFLTRGFSTPVSLTANRSDLDFVAVDKAVTTPLTLLPSGSMWRYWDQGTDPGAAWRNLAFDDSAWNEGPAILGYGGDKETTVISYGPNSSSKFITSWFRRQFVVEDPARLSNVRLALLRDDGAVVHLNGRELLRDNMPSGTITPQTLASTTVSGNNELTYWEFSIDPTRLVAGTNQFAVEVHQIVGTSSDIGFDLRLTADAAIDVEPGLHLVRPSSGDTFTAPGRIVLSATLGGIDGGGVLHHVEFLADSNPVGSATNPPLAVVWSDAPPGDHLVTAVAHLTDGRTLESPGAKVIVRHPDLNPTLIARGSVWRYLDTGVAPASTWRASDFDDATWRSGPARLGYGEDGEFSLIQFGSDPARRFITTWFRHSFELFDAANVTNLVGRLQKDDGAVVSLNGREMARFGLPATGTITPTQLATSDITNDAEQAWTTFTLDPTALREGLNVIAVEVHQASASSSDLGFDFELTAARSKTTEVPGLDVSLDRGRAVLRWPSAATGWRVETTPVIDGTVAWQPAVGTPQVVGDRFELSIDPAAGVAFFRLARQP